MRLQRSLWLLPVAIACSFWVTSTLYALHKTSQNQYISRLIYLPPAVLKAVSLEFSGMVSDYLMLQTMVFHGERLMSKQPLTVEEWQATNLALQQVTTLDQRFWDPYVLAETSFPWDANMVQEANALLLKAASVRTDDYRPYFFLWFNHSYFLKDIETATKYLEKASRIPGAPVYLVTLAARNNLESGHTESGILFLEEILKETADPTRREWIMLRLQALKTIAFLEENIATYRQKFGTQPDSLQELVNKHLIKEIPPDPYGGNFFITENGKVYTSSKLMPVETKKQE